MTVELLKMILDSNRLTSWSYTYILAYSCGTWAEILDLTSTYMYHNTECMHFNLVTLIPHGKYSHWSCNTGNHESKHSAIRLHKKQTVHTKTKHKLQIFRVAVKEVMTSRRTVRLHGVSLKKGNAAWTQAVWLMKHWQTLIRLFQNTPLLRNNNCIPGGGGIVHFNNVLGVTASILIKSSGRNLSHYLSSEELEKCSSTGVYSY